MSQFFDRLIDNLERGLPPDVLSRLSKYLPFLIETLDQYEINNPNRVENFLAQLAHESHGFKYTVENLNYSARRLRQIFRKYFTYEESLEFQRKPERIANRVYAGRMGNGDEASGEGYKYRGRGLIQLTGKYNYQQLSKATGIDFIKSPDKLKEPKYSLLAAAWYWNSRKLNGYADNIDVRAITRRINGGYNGLNDRINWLRKFQKAIPG